MCNVFKLISVKYQNCVNFRQFQCFPNNRRVATCQGKVREKQNFLQVRELSGNFEKMSGNFGHFTNVREMSGNFVMTIFSEHGWHFFCLHTFSSPKIFVSLASLSIYSHHTFFKMLYYFYEYCFILLLSGKNI